MCRSRSNEEHRPYALRHEFPVVTRPVSRKTEVELITTRRRNIYGHHGALPIHSPLNEQLNRERTPQLETEPNRTNGAHIFFFNSTARREKRRVEGRDNLLKHRRQPKHNKANINFSDYSRCCSTAYRTAPKESASFLSLSPPFFVLGPMHRV